jgi:outer membrane protein assembly factor BamA
MREGNGPDLALPASLTALVDHPFEPLLLEAAVQELRPPYLEHGYANATVNWRITRSGDLVDVVIEIAPGAQTVIDSVQLHGASKAHQGALAKIAEQDFPRGTPLEAERVEHAELSLEEYYNNRGYAEAHVRATPPSAGHGPLVFEISEGAQFRLGTIQVTGLAPTDAQREMATISRRLKYGDMFAKSKVIEEFQALSDRLHRHITPLTQINTARKTFDVTFEVEP